MSNVTTKHLTPGATWVFVHTNGKRVEYVYDRQMIGRTIDPEGKTPGLDAVHALLNPETGKFAQVSERWLTEKPTPNKGHWEAIAEAPTMAEAA